MQIIKNRQIINNQWQLESANPDLDLLLADDAPPRLIPQAAWLEIREDLKFDNDRIGVFLSPDDDISSISDDLDIIPVIALIFNDIAEGRGYSQAAELRYSSHYAGEIRAIGASTDNLLLMERCGINAFQLGSAENLEQALSYFTDIETVYRYS